MSKLRLITVLTMVTASLLFGAAGAGGQSDGLVAQRQQAMKHMAAAAKTIAGMFGGTQDYDVETFRAAAAHLLYNSGERLSTLFEAEATNKKSSAEAERIAAERQAFDGIAARLEELATAFDDKALQAGEVIPRYADVSEYSDDWWPFGLTKAAQRACTGRASG